MDRWMLIIAIILAAVAAVQGARYVHRGHKSQWTVLWMLFCFIAQLTILSIRGEMRASCPLGDTGEVLIFFRMVADDVFIWRWVLFTGFPYWGFLRRRSSVFYCR